jgi:hypothetical protein
MAFFFSAVVNALLVVVGAQYFSMCSITSSVPAAWETKGLDAGLYMAFCQEPAGRVTVEFHGLRGCMDDEYAGAAGQ